MIALALVAGINKSNFTDLSTSNIISFRPRISSLIIFPVGPTFESTNVEKWHYF